MLKTRRRRRKTPQYGRGKTRNSVIRRMFGLHPHKFSKIVPTNYSHSPSSSKDYKIYPSDIELQFSEKASTPTKYKKGGVRKNRHTKKDK